MNKFKRLIQLFLFAFVGLTGVSILAIIYVNPYGYYGDLQLGEFGLTNARKIKLNYLKSLNEKPEILVLGSSNSMRMLPSTLESEFGMKAFNYGVFQATVEDYYCISKAVFEQEICKPKLVLLCVDDWNFRAYKSTKTINMGGAGKRLLYKPTLSQYLHEFSSFKLFVMRLQTVVDWELLKASVIELMKFNFNREEVPLSKAFRPDGVRKYYFYNDIDLSELAETGTFDIGAEMKKRKEFMSTFPGGGVGGGHEYFDSFSDNRLQLLEELFDYLEMKGCSVIVNIMPIQPDYQKQVEAETDYTKRMKRLKLVLERQSNKHRNIVLVMDNHKIEYFDGEANHFFDHIHPTSVNSDKMLKRIFQNIPLDAF